mgnify:FL=1|jgi:hypothetical protein|tara:strand:- start:152 stop:433 length:282 start_codon:yes stop_codon:yes gene_type:complete
MQNIKQFWINSYKLSPVAFYCEMIEAVFLITASAVLSFTILDPDGWHFVPLYLIGSMLGIISAIIRQAAFVIVLCSWFTAMNLYALVQLIGAL